MISRIDPHDAEAFDAWYEAMWVACREGREDAAIQPRSVLRGALTAAREDTAFQLHAAWEGDRIVGTLQVDLPLKENLEHAGLSVTVVPDRRNRGLGTRLLAEADRVMSEEGRTAALAEVPVPAGWTADTWPGSRFAAKHGFKVGLEEDSLKLDLPVSPEHLAGLRPDITPYRLRDWSGPCPDPLIEDYAHLRTVIQADMPFGDIAAAPEVWDVERVRALERRRDAAGIATLITAAESPAGELVGVTALLMPDEPGLVIQEDTVVVGEHRGHRLGMALKVHNLERLAREFPNRTLVRTWNAVGNDHMLDINLALGFKVDERFLDLQRLGI